MTNFLIRKTSGDHSHWPNKVSRAPAPEFTKPPGTPAAMPAAFDEVGDAPPLALPLALPLPLPPPLPPPLDAVLWAVSVAVDDALWGIFVDDTLTDVSVGL